jgi:hypothetical protein
LNNQVQLIVFNNVIHNPAQRISIGSLAIAKLETPACDRGEIGICYAIHQNDARGLGATELRYAFIFEQGRFDAFTRSEVDTTLLVRTDANPRLADYRITSEAALLDDWRKGVFDFGRPVGFIRNHPQ